MDKKSIVAIALCALVIVAASVVQQCQAVKADAIAAQAAQTAQDAGQAPQTPPDAKAPEGTQTGAEGSGNWSGGLQAGKVSKSEEPFVFENDVFRIVFDPKGASVSSLRLKKYKEDGDAIDLLYREPGDHNAFLLYLGSDLESPLIAPFDHRVEKDKVVFSQEFEDPGTGKSLTIKKTFEFKEGDYLFKVSVGIDSDSPLDFGGAAYTLGFEPQIGPRFAMLKNDAYNYRRFYISSIKKNGKDKKLMAKLTNGRILYEEPFKWVDLTGKYFSSVAMPEKGDFDFIATERTQKDGVPTASSYFLKRNATGEASIRDEVFFYCGPQLKEHLGSYYSPTANAWGLQGRNLDMVLDGGSWLSWLENILKWLLDLFHALVPNYGVAIILVTVFIKLLTYPLTKKSSASSAKMAALTPQLEELKTRYKDNPEKLNQATMELYKDEGVNPMSGCLPMLIQFPILFAFFGLINKHFELRGAMFIPFWITDLSVPDTVLTFGFNIPLLGNQLHLLPLIYTASMIYSSKLLSGSAPQQGSMKFMTYGMPIVFFFVLYNAPSGLLLYWTVQNGLSMLEQLILRIRKRKEDANPSLARPTRKQRKEAEAQVPEAIRRYEEKKRRQADAARGRQKK